MTSKKFPLFQFPIDASALVPFSIPSFAMKLPLYYEIKTQTSVYPLQFSLIYMMSPQTSSNTHSTNQKSGNRK